MRALLRLVAYLRDLLLRFLRNHPASPYEQIVFDAVRTSAYSFFGRRALA